jgi:DNA invertase Pin-like site-specific DNA recombinase
MQIGYARVSTDDQNLALQMDALKNAGCARIFSDEGISGVVTSRPALDNALAALAPGDVLVTWKLDRLGRSLAHLIQITGKLAAQGVGFRSLSEAIDTTTASGRLLFHIMGALAEFERALISERTRAGMASARARGSRLGRPLKLGHEALCLAQSVLAEGNTSAAEIARSCGVSPITLERALKRLQTA